MKRKAIFYLIAAVFVLISPGCKKLFGLNKQTDVDHPTTTIDPHINKTAWQFLVERATGQPDSIFNLMYQAILYSGIDSAEYTKPNRTYIFLHNDAIYRKSGSTVTTDCYWGKYKVNGQPATSWSQYPQIQVKNYLLSLIMEGEYSFNNVPPDPIFVTTLMPLGYDPLNPQSLIAFRVINDRDSRFRINDFPGSDFPTVNTTTPGLQARTAGIIATNGIIHVADRVVYFQRH